MIVIILILGVSTVHICRSNHCKECITDIILIIYFLTGFVNGDDSLFSHISLKCEFLFLGLRYVDVDGCRVLPSCKDVFLHV